MGQPEDERRMDLRRHRDRELEAMSMQAKDLAQAAIGEIRLHVAVCEQQNKDVLERLTRQDRTLAWIIGLLLSGLGALSLELLVKALH